MEKVMLHYPVDFPADAARVLVGAWRDGTIASKRAEAAEAAWNLAGYGMKASLGETQANGGNLLMANPSALDLNVSPDGSPMDDDQMIAALETHENTPHDKRVVGALPIPPAVLAKWAVSIAIKILAGLV